MGLAAVPRPTLIRLPGYPLFLAACFRLFGMEHYGAVLLVQIAVDLWTCLLLGGVAARMLGRRAGAGGGLAGGALCPFTANYTAAPLTETLTLVLHGAGLLWAGSVRRWSPGGYGSLGVGALGVCAGVCGACCGRNRGCWRRLWFRLWDGWFGGGARRAYPRG